MKKQKAIKIIRSNGEVFEPTECIKNMFLRQWVNGDIKTYMASVKRRVKEMYNIDLVFKDKSEFYNELLKHGLIEIIPKD